MPFDPQKFAPEGDASGREAKPYTGTVIDAFFVTSQYGREQLTLRTLLDEADQMLYPWMQSGEDTRWFDLGGIQTARGEKFAKWEIVGDGTAVKGDSDARMFRADCDMGRLCAAVFALPNVSDLPDDFDPRVAASWKGLTFTWGNVMVQKRQKQDDDTWKNVTVPMELPTAMGAGVTHEVALAVDLATLGLTDEQKEALIVANTTDASDAQFASAALSIPGLMANNVFVQTLNTNVKGLRGSLPF